MQVPVARNDLRSTFARATGLRAAVCVKFDIARPPGRRTKACLSPSKERPQFLYIMYNILYRTTVCLCATTAPRRPALGVSATKMRKREFYTRARMRSTAWNAAFTSSLYTRIRVQTGGACIEFPQPSRMRCIG
jgi:hypothetical protein